MYLEGDTLYSSLYMHLTQILWYLDNEIQTSDQPHKDIFCNITWISDDWAGY